MNTIVNFFRRKYRNFKLRKNAIKDFIKYWKSEKWHQSYYEGAVKSKLQIWFELMFGIIKDREFNLFYYAYGLNLVDSDPKKYSVYVDFREERNKFNYRSISQRGIGYNYLAITRDKFIFSQYLKSLQIPTVENQYMYTNKQFRCLKTGKYLNYNEFVEVNNGEFFCKEISGEGGQEAFKLSIKDKNIKINNKAISFDDSKFFWSDGFLIQECIKQCDQISKIFPKSVNTVRVISTRINHNEVIIPSAIFRCGTGNNTADNWWLGGLSVNVCLESGKLDKYGFYKPGYGTKTEKHPDSQVVFEDFQLPYWDEIKKIVMEAHKYFYGIATIGWDVAITKDGPVLIEANEDWEISLSQVASMGKFAKKELKSMFDLVKE